MRQLSLFSKKHSRFAQEFSNSGQDGSGAVFTRAEVVNFILDLTGYTVDMPLYEYRALEPSFGNGDFLVPVVKRLLSSLGDEAPDSHLRERLKNAIRAVEINRVNAKKTCERLLRLLLKSGFQKVDAQLLIDSWIITDDFLLTDLPFNFTHVVGNPPYVRQELIPDSLLAEYRGRYSTIFARADLYIPFMEKSLKSLDPKGILGFICSDRWMKNRYGEALRAMVARDYHLLYHVDMNETRAFCSDVIAYPAITVISKDKPGFTRIAKVSGICPDKLSSLAFSMKAGNSSNHSGVTNVTEVVKGKEPWILKSFDRLAIVRRLEAEFPPIEETGCKIGIGVATGADKVYIKPFDDLDVEQGRKLPIVKTKDIKNGIVNWQGLGIINPFHENGSPVDLSDYPKLKKYFLRHEAILKNRNCAKRNPKAWFRTIDRIYPELMQRAKLLIPDIKGEANVVYESGRFYPHHNLYVITSDEWDLKALQAVLRSGIAKLFVSVYSTRMRGGYLRFQAQYLRRIRLPHWKDAPKEIRDALITSAKAGDLHACNEATYRLYNLSPGERKIMKTIVKKA